MRDVYIGIEEMCNGAWGWLPRKKWIQSKKTNKTKQNKTNKRKSKKIKTHSSQRLDIEPWTSSWALSEPCWHAFNDLELVPPAEAKADICGNIANSIGAGNTGASATGRVPQQQPCRSFIFLTATFVLYLVLPGVSIQWPVPLETKSRKGSVFSRAGYRLKIQSLQS